MDKKRPRVTAEIERDLYRRIEDYRFRNRFPNQSAAVRELLRRGLERNPNPAREGHNGRPHEQ